MDFKLVDKSGKGSEEMMQEGSGELFALDPSPSEPARTRQKTPSKPAAKPPTVKAQPAPRKPPAARAKSSASLARDVAEDMAAAFELAGTLWGARDDVCGPALAENARPIAEALASVLETWPRLLQMFAFAEQGTILVKVIALFTAVRPVVQAVRSHHGGGASSSREEPDEGPMDGAPDLSVFPAFSGVPRGHQA